MPTPKPGQIRCPTCQQPTPQAAYCTQCGAPLPSSLQARPRGMDRAELEERVRHRRPGDPALRRGRTGADTSPAGYVPFQPEPEDANALREAEWEEHAAHVDNTPPDFDQQLPPLPPAYRAPRGDQAAAAAAGYAAASGPEPAPEQVDAYQPDPYAAPRGPATYGEAPADDAPYGAPEDAYPYAYPADDGGGRGGSSALPIIGFILLGVLALGVGAVLATLLGGDGGVGEASPTPTSAVVATPSEVPSVPPSEAATDGPSTTPEPTDGPVTFPDGAVITVQPCATADMGFEGCAVDGSTITEPTMWVWLGFDDANGTDTFTLTLRSEGQTIDQQEKVLGQVINGCPATCSGYLIGAAYRGLERGEYELVVRRNDDFADSATFRVE
ncbi:MAG TPA: hypothetical protein VFY43_00895 [Candidatus Limnocylindria bacterium]|nr:hypothetical protein [Candidatus Limnocylindria bacterium]